MHIMIRSYSVKTNQTYHMELLIFLHNFHDSRLKRVQFLLKEKEEK